MGTRRHAASKRDVEIGNQEAHQWGLRHYCCSTTNQRHPSRKLAVTERLRVLEVASLTSLGPPARNGDQVLKCGIIHHPRQHTNANQREKPPITRRRSSAAESAAVHVVLHETKGAGLDKVTPLVWAHQVLPCEDSCCLTLHDHETSASTIRPISSRAHRRQRIDRRLYQKDSPPPSPT